MRVETIVLYRKLHTPKADLVAEEIRSWAADRGISAIDGNSLSASSWQASGIEMDLIVVLGGDGTMLSTARKLAGRQVPLLGVNLGSLGFLTEITLNDLYPTLEQLLDGKTALEHRSVLYGCVERKGSSILTCRVLNDIVLNKGTLARMSDLEVRVDDSFVTTYRGDGLVVATPTGSTAYSLSAGGPIVSPDLEAIILTPICPHTLTHRPILVRDSSVLEIRMVSKNGEVFLTLDGQQGFELEEHDVVRVERAKKGVLLVRSVTRDYFQVLRTKLMWGGRYSPGVEP